MPEFIFDLITSHYLILAVNFSLFLHSKGISAQIKHGSSTVI